ncbi:MAG: TagF domain-containing protein [Paracoccus sp. (in: a-proteobacteria)]|nr:TagF domain-containing protein [Paracoccus sp. (in: a-proteobacteria)]
MPDQHRLSGGRAGVRDRAADDTGAQQGAGLWGKHPGHGDFLAAGLPEGLRAMFVPWLDACLTGLREGWGEAGWGAGFDAMPPVCFWFGPALTGAAPPGATAPTGRALADAAGGDAAAHAAPMAGAPLVGVMIPSRDRVGRRYPLVIMGRGAVAPPMLSGGSFHAEAEAALGALMTQPRVTTTDWPRALGEVVPTGVADVSGLVWARNPGLPGAGLLGEMAGFDHLAAAAGRAYLWTGEAAHAGAALACAGLPDARALAWLIGAAQRAPDEAGSAVTDAARAPLARPPQIGEAVTADAESRSPFDGADAAIPGAGEGVVQAGEAEGAPDADAPFGMARDVVADPESRSPFDAVDAAMPGAGDGVSRAGEAEGAPDADAPLGMARDVVGVADAESRSPFDDGPRVVPDAVDDMAGDDIAGDGVAGAHLRPRPAFDTGAGADGETGRPFDDGPGGLPLAEDRARGAGAESDSPFATPPYATDFGGDFGTDPDAPSPFAERVPREAAGATDAADAGRSGPAAADPGKAGQAVAALASPDARPARQPDAGTDWFMVPLGGAVAADALQRPAIAQPSAAPDEVPTAADAGVADADADAAAGEWLAEARALAARPRGQWTADDWAVTGSGISGSAISGSEFSDSTPEGHTPKGDAGGGDNAAPASKDHRIPTRAQAATASPAGQGQDHQDSTGRSA